MYTLGRGVLQALSNSPAKCNAPVPERLWQVASYLYNNQLFFFFNKGVNVVMSMELPVLYLVAFEIALGPVLTLQPLYGNLPDQQ